MNNYSCDKQKLEKIIEFYQGRAVYYSRKVVALEESVSKKKSHYNELVYIRYILLEGPREVKKLKTKYFKKGFIQTIIIAIILFVFQESLNLGLIELLMSSAVATSTIASIHGFNFLKTTKKTRHILKNNTSKVVESNLEIAKEEIVRHTCEKEKYLKMEEELKKVIRNLIDNSKKSNHYRDLSTIEIDYEILKKLVI